MDARLRFVCSASLSMFCTANALATVPGSVPADNIVYFSGSSALDANFELFPRLKSVGLCYSGEVSGTQYEIRIFKNATQRVVTCTGVISTTVVNFGIAKESVLGSISAFDPVAGSTNISWLDVRATGFACGGVDGNMATADAGSYNQPVGIDAPVMLVETAWFHPAFEYTNCSPDTLTQQSMAGVAGVDAGLFGYTNLVDERPLGQILLGVPVSLNLYRALQVAQGIAARTDCDMPAERDTQLCVPSLVKGQIAALYSGNYASWDQFTVISGGVPTPLTQIPGISAPADSSVYLCRRGNSSSRQVFTRAYALAQGCGGADSFREATNPLCETNGCSFPTSGPIPFDLVYANSTNDSVRDCLDQRDDDNVWAVGVMTTENTVNDIGGTGGDARDTLGAGGSESHTREFRFLGIHGFNPSLEVAANGGYDMVAESVCTVNLARLGAAPGGTLRTALFEAICGDNAGSMPGLMDLALLRTFNESFDNQPHGDGGHLAKPDFVLNLPNIGPVSQAEMEANPVNAHTRSALGSVNNCSAYQAVGDTDAGAAALRGPVLPGDLTP